MPSDKLTGDPDGIAALKAFAQEHRDYLKFLLNEAKTNLDHTTSFTAADGTKYLVHFDLNTGKITVKKPS